MIKFPIAVKRSDDARFAYLIDADDQVIAGAIHLEDAEQLVRAANAGAVRESIPKPARRKSKREMIADKLRDSDPIAVIMGRDDEIIYGPHDDLPQPGESVARLVSKAR